MRQRAFPEAMNLFTQTLSEAEKNHDDLTAERCIGYISNIYFNYGDYNRNLHYLLKGYNMAKENGHDEPCCQFCVEYCDVLLQGSVN